jgi:hypothetical protein
MSASVMLYLTMLIILPIPISVKYCGREAKKGGETQSRGETIGEMIDRIIGEVAREWVAEDTGLKD